MLGEDVAAFVVLGPGPDRWPPTSCSTFAGERLADYKVPRQVEYLAALPRNAGGKVVKSELVAGTGGR